MWSPTNSWNFNASLYFVWFCFAVLCCLVLWTIIEKSCNNNKWLARAANKHCATCVCMKFNGNRSNSSSIWFDLIYGHTPHSFGFLTQSEWTSEVSATQQRWVYDCDCRIKRACVFIMAQQGALRFAAWTCWPVGSDKWRLASGCGCRWG